MFWRIVIGWALLFSGFCFGFYYRGKTFNGRLQQMRGSLEDITQALSPPVVMISHRPDCPVNLPRSQFANQPRICNCDFAERFASYLQTTQPDREE